MGAEVRKKQDDDGRWESSDMEKKERVGGKLQPAGKLRTAWSLEEKDAW